MCLFTHFWLTLKSLRDTLALHDSLRIIWNDFEWLDLFGGVFFPGYFFLVWQILTTFFCWTYSSKDLPWPDTRTGWQVLAALWAILLHDSKKYLVPFFLFRAFVRSIRGLISKKLFPYHPITQTLRMSKWNASKRAPAAKELLQRNNRWCSPKYLNWTQL